jgi:protocatechuate 3,4-dioxygenase beta subunit
MAAAAAALVLAVLWEPTGLGDWVSSLARGDSSGAAEAERVPAEAIREDVERRATLRGLPGMEEAAAGTGILTGDVRLHVAGSGARPLPGVRVEVLGVARGRGIDLAAETGEDGTFTLRDVPAVVGYAVVVRHPPYRDVVLRGVGVAKDRTTDVGTILLGAPTALVGQVVDAVGRPLAGATVQVFRDASRPDSFDLRRGLFDLQGAADPLASAASAGDGQFVLKDLVPGRYLLRVSAPGHAAAFRSGVVVSVDERSPSVRVVLDPGAGYEGFVRDEDGRPVAGARLVAVAIPGERLSRLDRVDVRSEADGSYRLDTLLPGVRYFVEAWAESFAPTGQFLVPQGIERRDFVVARSGRVEGRIADAVSGRGVVGAEVTLVAGKSTTMSPVSAVTDADGRFALPHVSPGPIVLFSARAPGYEAAGFTLNDGGGRAVLAGATLVVDWALKPGGSVAGRIAAEDGRPVPYATVAVVDPRRRWEGEETALTGADGRYSIGGLRAATYELRVAAAGYAPLTEDDAAKVVVPPDLAAVTKDVVLARGAAVTGAVKTPEGRPLPGARVEVAANGGGAVRNRVRDLEGVTDAAGAYRIPGVPPHVEVVVVATHDQYVRTVSGPLRLSPGAEARADLVMREGAKVPGRVTDARGRPVEGARVRWGHVDADREGRLRDAFRADEVLGPRVLRADADGRFLIDRLEPGRTLVKVEHEGYADWYRKDLVVGDEGVQAALGVVLEGALSIRGRVLADDSGQGIPGAWVYAQESDPAAGEASDPGRVRALVSVQTGPDGSFVLDRLPPVRCEVVVWLAVGYAAAAQDWKNPAARRPDVVPNAAGVDFRLAPAVPPAVGPGR